MEVSERASAAGRHTRRLAIVLALTATYMAVEVVGALVTNSLALLADAGHMLTDVFGLGLALFAIWVGSRAATPSRTYGYQRTEILAALINALILFLLAGYIAYEAWRRLQEVAEVQSIPMLVVAAIGMVVNLIGAWLLHSGAQESLNVRGAFLEVVSDLLGSLAVVTAALIIWFTNWYYVDPIFSILIALFIVPRTWRLFREAVGILLEGTPSHLNLADVRGAMEAMPAIESVHDLHVWAITSGYVTLSAHARLNGGVDSMETLAQLTAMLKERFDIDHTTIQLEEPSYEEAPLHE